jgi:hypothetical protein
VKWRMRARGKLHGTGWKFNMLDRGLLDVFVLTTLVTSSWETRAWLSLVGKLN